MEYLFGSWKVLNKNYNEINVYLSCIVNLLRNETDLVTGKN